MPRPFLIIDGYNLMHACGMARHQYGPGDLERCREWFLNYVARRLTQAERGRTTIVFDAGEAAPVDAPRRYVRGEMQIRFADRGTDADSLIEELIADHSSPRQVQVVSGDRRLQRAARRRRAAWIASGDFAARLKSREDRQEADRASPKDSRHPKFTGQLPAGEVQQWMKVFGDVQTSPESAESAGAAIEPPAKPARAPVPSKPPLEPETRETPAGESEKDGTSTSTPEELRFWRSRVAELLNEEEGSGASPSSD